MTVQDNIPLPSRKGHGSRYAHITADLVKAGQSKFAACPDDEHIAIWQKRLSAQAASKFGAGNYATRTVTENGRLGIRIWRLA